ncbi:MAG: hypothetical protein Q7Q71_02445 [Verrucomicrobiota bacterium JB023]|nr:hypothetical protein [Verrucomicrobiota bacterium JB023]
MRARCGHRDDDVGRGWSFAWRVRDGSDFRFILAVGLALACTLLAVVGLNIRVRESFAADGEHLPPVRLVSPEVLRGSSLERFAESRSPVSALDAGWDEPLRLDDWLERLGLNEDAVHRPALIPPPVREPLAEVSLPPVDLTLPPAPTTEFAIPPMREGGMVLLTGKGRLRERLAPVKVEWEGSLPTGGLRFWAVIDEDGLVEMALPEERGLDSQVTNQARRILESLRFGAGPRRAGPLSFNYQEEK